MNLKKWGFTCLVASLSLTALGQSGAPEQQRRDQPARDYRPEEKGQKYTLEQAISDKAQLHTIAFDGLAFLTGDFSLDTFLPPGKVSDYFGFQYMRDIDAGQLGHNTDFLTRIANNMLSILTPQQLGELQGLARAQEADIRKFAQMRFPLIKAFRRNLEKDYPASSKGLSEKAVQAASADLYELDGKLAYQRAKVMGRIISQFNDQQKAALSKLKFGDSRTWPNVPETIDRRSMSHEAHVAVMTYASEMFAWYAGSIDADVYFCPERHGMYFGGFGMKTAPAMGKRNYSISTSLTGDSGENFLSTLNDTQHKLVSDVITRQRKNLQDIVSVRKQISAELRKFQTGATADEKKVITLSRRYGELDGQMSYWYADAFARISQTLMRQQKDTLNSMRTRDPNEPRGPFLYSTPISMPTIENTDRFFSQP